MPKPSNRSSLCIKGDQSRHKPSSSLVAFLSKEITVAISPVITVKHKSSSLVDFLSKETIVARNLAISVRLWVKESHSRHKLSNYRNLSVKGNHCCHYPLKSGKTSLAELIQQSSYYEIARVFLRMSSQFL